MISISKKKFDYFRGCLPGTIVSLFLLFNALPSVQAYTEEDAKEFDAILRKNFQKWDFNQSGVLTEEELDLDIQDARIRGIEAAAVSAIKVYSRGVWKRDTERTYFALDELVPFDDSGLTERGKKIVDLFAKYKIKIAKESPQLFSDGGPHIGEIHQGRTGDCYFLATAGGLAYHQPNLIQQMIGRNQDGSYTVVFPRHEPIVVPSPTDCEIACYSDAGQDGLWLHVLEKAYAVYKNRKKGDADEEALDVVIRGGSGARMIMFMTGNACHHYSTRETPHDELRQEVASALAEHRVVNTATPGHCLTIVGYDPQSDAITVWNPWGTSVFYKPAGQQMKDGFFTMPFEDFCNNFVAVLPELRRPWRPEDWRSHGRK